MATLQDQLNFLCGHAAYLTKGTIRLQFVYEEIVLPKDDIIHDFNLLQLEDKVDCLHAHK